ncbi:MAG: HD domain-containing protein [Anaerovoracaceae bacterium]
MTPGAASGITPAMTPDMHRLDKICSHPLWQKCLGEIGRLEENRIFCRHDVQHFLDVARIAYIENLEQEVGIPKELIYAAALLHDIGRHLQYTEGISHEEASAQLAETILTDCGFTVKEKEEILQAIGLHRNPGTAENTGLAGLLYRADKKSRACGFCEAKEQCNWPEEKKNLKLTI